jgi:hypothetical protein
MANSEAISFYNQHQPEAIREICSMLQQIIDKHLPLASSRIWHAHPVWFLEDNPIVGYSLQKRGVRLMFWSGADFDEPALCVVGKKFKDASIFYNDVSDVIEKDVVRWLGKAEQIQWDYKNIVKRKGRLERLK